MAHSSTKIYVEEGGTGIRLQQDLQVFFGIVGGLGYIISQLASRTNGINVWAKYKPIRKNSVSAVTYEERKNCDFGITRNASTGYWEWNYPRGGNDGKYRMLDFNGYNSAALCPVKDISDNYIPSSFNPSVDQITIVAENLFAYGSNVEIPLKDLGTIYTGSHYVGLLFHNTTRGTQHVYTIDDTVTVATDGSATHSYGYNISLSTLGYQAGDVVDVYVCGYDTNTSGQPVVPSQAVDRLIKMALAPNAGKARFTCIGWYMANIRYIGMNGLVNAVGDDVMLYIAYTTSGSRATFTSFGMRMKDTNTYTNGTIAYLRLAVEVGGTTYIPTSSTLVSSAPNERIDLSLSCNASADFASDYEVPLTYYLKVYDSNGNLTATKTLISGVFNVNTRNWTRNGSSATIVDIYTNPSSLTFASGSATFNVMARTVGGTTYAIMASSCQLSSRNTNVATVSSTSGVTAATVTKGSRTGNTTIDVAYTSDGDTFRATCDVTITKTLTRIAFGTSTGGSETSQYNAVSGKPCRIYVYAYYSDGTFSDVSGACTYSKVSGPSTLTFSTFSSGASVTGTNSTSIIQFNDIRATYNGYTADVSVRVSPA